MSGSSDQTKDMVLEYCWKNQISEVDGEEKNYLSGMADEFNLHIDTITRAVDWLEKWGIVKTWRDGNKRLVRVTVDLGKSKRGSQIEE